LPRQTAAEFNPEALKLIDSHLLGSIPRRTFLNCPGEIA
jgi:hypothetical protein